LVDRTLGGREGLCGKNEELFIVWVASFGIEQGGWTRRRGTSCRTWNKNEKTEETPFIPRYSRVHGIYRTNPRGKQIPTGKIYRSDLLENVHHLLFPEKTNILSNRCLRFLFFQMLFRDVACPHRPLMVWLTNFLQRAAARDGG
jgi:hypothetical protein